MLTHPEAYWRGIAAQIDAEERKASAYLHDDEHRLDVLRDEILRRAVTEGTPAPLRVGRGMLLATNVTPSVASPRCELLVFDPSEQAYLQLGDFGVLPHTAARFVIETRALFNQPSLDGILAQYDALRPLIPPGMKAPLVGLGFDGIPFDAFVAHMREVVKANRLQIGGPQRHLNWPVAFACHRQNYFALRPTTHLVGGTYWLGAVDCDQVTPGPTSGLATALFFRHYVDLLAGKPIEGPRFRQWFNEFPVAHQGKLWVNPDGQVFRGNIPG